MNTLVTAERRQHEAQENNIEDKWFSTALKWSIQAIIYKNAV